MRVRISRRGLGLAQRLHRQREPKWLRQQLSLFRLLLRCPHHPTKKRTLSLVNLGVKKSAGGRMFNQLLILSLGVSLSLSLGLQLSVRRKMAAEVQAQSRLLGTPHRLPLPTLAKLLGLQQSDGRQSHSLISLSDDLLAAAS